MFKPTPHGNRKTNLDRAYVRTSAPTLIAAKRVLASNPKTTPTELYRKMQTDNLEHGAISVVTGPKDVNQIKMVKKAVSKPNILPHVDHILMRKVRESTVKW